MNRSAQSRIAAIVVLGTAIAWFAGFFCQPSLIAPADFGSTNADHRSSVGANQTAPAIGAERTVAVPSEPTSVGPTVLQACFVLDAADGAALVGLELSVEREGSGAFVCRSELEGKVMLPIGNCRLHCPDPAKVVVEPAQRIEVGRPSVVWVADLTPAFVRVVDERFHPIASAVVSGSKPEKFRITNDEGLAPLDPGQIELSVACVGYVPVHDVLPARIVGEHSVMLQRSAALGGPLRCVDTEGEPLAGVVVRANLARPTESGSAVVTLGHTDERGELQVPAECLVAPRYYFSGTAFPCVLTPSSSVVGGGEAGRTFVVPRTEMARIDVHPAVDVMEPIWQFEQRGPARDGDFYLGHLAPLRRVDAGWFEVAMPLQWPVAASCIDGRGRTWQGSVRLIDQAVPIRVELASTEALRRVTLISSDEPIERVRLSTTGPGAMHRSLVPVSLTKTGLTADFAAPICSCSFEVTGARGTTCIVECSQGTAPQSLVLEALSQRARVAVLVVDERGQPVHDVIVECKRQLDLQRIIAMNDAPCAERLSMVTQVRVAHDGVADCLLPPGEYRIGLLHLPWRRTIRGDIEAQLPTGTDVVRVAGDLPGQIRLTASRPRRISIRLTARDGSRLPAVWQLHNVHDHSVREFRGEAVELWTASAGESWQVRDVESRVLATFQLPAGVQAVEVVVPVGL
ncbi:MAG: hypothetical protein MUC36_16485 [Planctomycetes bacterium]|nr:hypothetical protein [Planctomycetota bacterium]